MEQEFEALLEGMKEEFATGNIGNTHFRQGVQKLNDLADLLSVTWRGDPDNTVSRELQEIETDSYGNSIHDNDLDDSYH